VGCACQSNHKTDNIWNKFPLYLITQQKNFIMTNGNRAKVNLKLQPYLKLEAANMP